MSANINISLHIRPLFTESTFPTPSTHAGDLAVSNISYCKPLFEEHPCAQIFIFLKIQLVLLSEQLERCSHKPLFFFPDCFLGIKF